MPLEYRAEPLRIYSTARFWPRLCVVFVGCLLVAISFRTSNSLIALVGMVVVALPILSAKYDVYRVEFRLRRLIVEEWYLAKQFHRTEFDLMSINRFEIEQRNPGSTDYRRIVAILRSGESAPLSKHHSEGRWTAELAAKLNDILHDVNDSNSLT